MSYRRSKIPPAPASGGKRTVVRTDIGAKTIVVPEAEKAGVKSLWHMLRWRRPAWSAQEEDFIRVWLDPLPGAHRDDIGNVLVNIPLDADTGTLSRVLWSSHTDTVHRHGGEQKLHYDQATGMIRVSPKRQHSNCLGADCTTGVWLMREMILAGVPGLYVFHRGEEVGGIGSVHIADEHSTMLSGIDYAIAFDRKGTSSIITHQMYDRCCSDAFARSLADALAGFAFKGDDTGTFTDTANYTDLIAECTNLSVGYYNQHTDMEAQDFGFACRLRDALVKFDETQLIAERKPGEKDRGWASYYGGGRRARCVYNEDDYYPFKSRDAALDHILRHYPDVVRQLLLDSTVDADDVNAALSMYGSSLLDLSDEAQEDVWS